MLGSHKLDRCLLLSIFQSEKSDYLEEKEESLGRPE